MSAKNGGALLLVGGVMLGTGSTMLAGMWVRDPALTAGLSTLISGGILLVLSVIDVVQQIRNKH